MFLMPEVFINIFVDTTIYIFFLISLYIAILVVKYFDINKDTYLQYSLEKRTYLVSTIVQYGQFLKIVLFFYFIFTLDKLSNIIPGAMCAAGVITANRYGVGLLVLKVLNLYLFGLWILANRVDLNTKDYRFTKFKFKFFIAIFLLITIELILEFLYFNAIDISKIVSCCGVLFNPISSSSVSLLLQIPTKIVVIVFYSLFIIGLVAAYFKRRAIYCFLNILFLIFSILAIIQFFSPYIYELPTHKCPFCFLQKEYFFVGYIIYSALFLGTFFAFSEWFGAKFLKKELNFFKASIFFNLIFVMILTSYVFVYYIKNGVWLF